ncbi:MAG: hypothetical protein JNL65_11540 [Saprospiraceae bacterium]|nr:hypothetical protein [Saprospiraceae bacterium]HRG69821.1 hypothetical protein [Saprospiraceae bacterium]
MTKQEFEQLNIELDASGLTLKSFMENRGFPIHQYHYWRKKSNSKDLSKSKNKFIQIGSIQSINSPIRLEYPNGVVINFQ